MAKALEKDSVETICCRRAAEIEKWRIYADFYTVNFQNTYCEEKPGSAEYRIIMI